MPDFDYQGVDRTGRKVSGSLTATSDGEVRMMLRQQGVRPIRIARQGGSGLTQMTRITAGQRSAGPGSLSLSLKERILFTRQLQVLVGSGIPLVQGLEIMAEQTISPKIKGMLEDVRDRVSQGSFFWEALSSYPKAFARIYVSLVRAGEASGSLDVVLKRLTRYLEDADRVRKMVIGALIYPAIILGVGMLIMVLMLIFVVPKLKDMLGQNNTALPLPTQIVVNISEFVSQNAASVLIGIFGGAFLTVRFVQTPEGKAVLDRFLYTLPLFGDLVQKGAIAGFSRTLQTLMMAGVNLIDAIEIARSTVENVVVADAVSKIRGEVESGKTLSAVIAGIPVFPRMAIQMITVGETTGNLDKMLEKVADFYEAEVESAVGTIGKLVEPLLLVFLGGMLAGMLLAMYLPIFSMAGAVGG